MKHAEARRKEFEERLRRKQAKKESKKKEFSERSEEAEDRNVEDKSNDEPGKKEESVGAQSSTGWALGGRLGGSEKESEWVKLERRIRRSWRGGGSSR